MTIKQTAGRDRLGNFAPDFAHFNDDILFGENWNIEAIDLKTRCLLTVTTLIASGITDSSLSFHLQNAKNNGVTKDEIAATITHIAFYAGWPKAWAAFNLAKDVWTDQPRLLINQLGLLILFKNQNYPSLTHFAVPEYCLQFVALATFDFY